MLCRAGQRQGSRRAARVCFRFSRLRAGLPGRGSRPGTRTARNAGHPRRGGPSCDRRDDHALRGHELGPGPRHCRAPRPATAYARRSLRSVTVAPSAGRSPTPIQPATCPRWRWRSAPPWWWRGPNGRRTVPASEFFVDYLQTALEPTEDARRGPGTRSSATSTAWGYRYEKFQRVAQAWAVVGVAALVCRSAGAIEQARIGLTNMGSRPLRATATEAALNGVKVTAGAVDEAAALAADGTSPPSDLSGQADYRAAPRPGPDPERSADSSRNIGVRPALASPDACARCLAGLRGELRAVGERVHGSRAGV